MNEIAPRQTARTAAGAPATDAVREYLTFGLGQESYGTDILKIQEIRSYEAPTRIANAPGCVKGVIDLRGAIVPIVDLRFLMNVSEATYDESTVVIIVGIGERTIGLVVDTVSDVVSLSTKQIRPAPQWEDGADAGYVVGLGCIAQGDGQRMLILVDIERLLAGGELGRDFSS
jgi:purine-binding chemotaxis protein CheW